MSYVRPMSIDGMLSRLAIISNAFVLDFSRSILCTNEKECVFIQFHYIKYIDTLSMMDELNRTYHLFSIFRTEKNEMRMGVGESVKRGK